MRRSATQPVMTTPGAAAEDVSTFAAAVIEWQRQHGRHDLPWQNTRDPYAIWVSEIMLQQTQVATVIPYYVRFMSRFPQVAALAAAPEDDVLAHWSGLGYYSRARNLQRAAKVICEQHGGHVPRDIDEVMQLPGIGRSTAAAIVVFSCGARHAILDGNVKRVLARYRGIAGYPGDKRVADALWNAADALLPHDHIERYTQGLMDLGATVCTRRARCELCPVSGGCVARRDGVTDKLPAARPRKALPHRCTIMLILEHRGALLLEKRAASGIWGGLWSFPEIADGDDVEQVCLQRFGASCGRLVRLPDVQHGFTHFTLTISPRHLEVHALEPRAGETQHQWIDVAKVTDAPIPAPVRHIAEKMQAAAAPLLRIQTAHYERGR
jgi:A/G-specific adenine glycosylase